MVQLNIMNLGGCTMKKNYFLTLFIASVVSLFLMVNNCGKKEETPGKKADPAVANQLIEAINKTPTGIKMHADPANISVTTSGERFLVTLKNPTVTFDTSILKSMSMGDQFKQTEIPITMEELTFLYGPEEKYLEAISVKGMVFEWDASKLLEKPHVPGTPPSALQMDIKFSAGNISYKNYNVSALLTYEGKDLFELLGQYIKDNQISEMALDTLKYEFGFYTEEGKNIWLLLEAEKMEGFTKAVSPVFISLYEKDAELPDFAKTLKQGTALLDVGLKCSMLKVTVKEEGIELGGGTLENTSLTYFLKPDETKSTFTYGSTWDVHNLSLTIPGHPQIERLGNIKDMKMLFALENLNPDFAKAYFELIKKSMSLSSTADKEKFRQQQAMMGMKIATEFIKSKPGIKLSLSPFKHTLGECTAEANFQFPSLMGPVGKAEVKVPDVNGILNKIKEEKLFPAEAMPGIEQTIKNIFVIDDSGSGSLTLEMKASQPGVYFLNGKPMGK